MKKMTFLALAFSINSVFAISWTEIGAKHPLFDSLTVSEVKVPHDFLQVTRKMIGNIQCTKSTLPRLNPIGTSQTQITCEVPDKLNSKEAQELFENVDATIIETEGAYSQYKQIGKILIFGSDETEEGEKFAKVYTQHPCQLVSSQKQASACMNFFAIALQPSFEDINTSALVKSTPLVKKKALEVFKIFAPWTMSTIKGTLSKTPYIGIMVQHIYAGRHFNYYTVNKGENVLPKQILNINMEDFGYMIEEETDGMTVEEIKVFAKGVLENLLLGLPKSAFPAFVDEYEYNLDYIE